MRDQFEQRGPAVKGEAEDNSDLDLQFEENALIKIEQKGNTIPYDISLHWYPASLSLTAYQSS